MAGNSTALVLSCLFFMACSAGMMIVNKMALRAVGLPLTVVMIQMAFTVLFLCATPCTLHFGSLRDVLRWAATVPFLFTLMLASSMLALDHASMGAIVVVRNIAPLVTMMIEGFFGEVTQVSCLAVISLLYIISGVVLYVSTDISFSATGLGYMCGRARAANPPTAPIRVAKTSESATVTVRDRPEKPAIWVHGAKRVHFPTRHDRLGLGEGSSDGARVCTQKVAQHDCRRAGAAGAAQADRNQPDRRVKDRHDADQQRRQPAPDGAAPLLVWRARQVVSLSQPQPDGDDPARRELRQRRRDQLGGHQRAGLRHGNHVHGTPPRASHLHFHPSRRAFGPSHAHDGLDCACTDARNELQLASAVFACRC
mmetsp:Transcript_55719/g.153283  ORF Transcript_55719/g.153283 Transcript_55719/m.153283 type:complete len:368 (-) Transcript_55719:706-1809(-)